MERAPQRSTHPRVGASREDCAARRHLHSKMFNVRDDPHVLEDFATVAAVILE